MDGPEQNDARVQRLIWAHICPQDMLAQGFSIKINTRSGKHKITPGLAPV